MECESRGQLSRADKEGTPQLHLPPDMFMLLFIMPPLLLNPTDICVDVAFGRMKIPRDVALHDKSWQAGSTSFHEWLDRRL